ncbi:IucA/IucC family siderophore biosynthesis protein [Paenibacillus sp. ACRRX]|uniref:IucA/IucC family protein n=1 Tax=Paenibacillus sp. ACRRX TaxID=2918206 RepID=UPI001EF59B3E|nr:IucA/IucC family protein [Paenibacillus sp. ACRRX]MCG7407367.1 IucA/IucC family siderophore biosynthesis protein [Paenibacillus sp. ACRRX]
MVNAKSVAEHMSMQSLLNCYIRETGEGTWVEGDRSLLKFYHDMGVPLSSTSFYRCYLPIHGAACYIPVRYRSLTGMHSFHFPAVYRFAQQSHYMEADYVTLTALLVKELTMTYGRKGSYDELMLRMIESCRCMQRFIEERNQDTELLYGERFSFIDSEQSLLFGHCAHPTPKSRQGIIDRQVPLYSPELGGKFQLHYFEAPQDLIEDQSSLPSSASELIRNCLLGDAAAESSAAELLELDTAKCLLPVHPLQAEWLMQQQDVIERIHSGQLAYLGPLGPHYYATSSLRTVYHPDRAYMFKLSFPVKVTNSMRINKVKELPSGVEMNQLMNTELGELLRTNFPQFCMIGDPASITLKPQYEEQIGADDSSLLEEAVRRKDIGVNCSSGKGAKKLRMEACGETGFEVVIRANPFVGQEAEQVTVLASLVQEPLPDRQSRLSRIIHRLAEEERRTVREVSLDWFARYLNISLKPMVWLYVEHGIALEAHQQNSLVKIQDGYPTQYYYRDNQGFYYVESQKMKLQQLVPGLGEKSRNWYSDQLVEDRFRYYVIVNHIFGLINSFGRDNLAGEHELLSVLRDELSAYVSSGDETPSIVKKLLEEDTIPCKANLMTRFYDIDELEGIDETPSVYIRILNPLAYLTRNQVDIPSVQESLLPAEETLSVAP